MREWLGVVSSVKTGRGVLDRANPAASSPGFVFKFDSQGGFGECLPLPFVALLPSRQHQFGSLFVKGNNLISLHVFYSLPCWLSRARQICNT